MFYGRISITRFFWSDWHMHMQWIPGPFSRVEKSLGDKAKPHLELIKTIEATVKYQLDVRAFTTSIMTSTNLLEHIPCVLYLDLHVCSIT